MILEINAKKRRALKIFKEQLEREARDAKELRENEIYFNGKSEGILIGENKGKLEEKLSTARRLKAMGFSDEVIAEGTGLSLVEVGSL